MWPHKPWVVISEGIILILKGEQKLRPLDLNRHSLQARCNLHFNFNFLSTVWLKHRETANRIMCSFTSDLSQMQQPKQTMNSEIRGSSFSNISSNFLRRVDTGMHTVLEFTF